MDAIGINSCLLLMQVVIIFVLVGFPIISLVDLGKRKLEGVALALWVLIICAIPVIGWLAYWIIRPNAEKK